MELEKGYLKSIMDFNDDFVNNKDYETFKTTKYPDKKIVVLSCMDTRLTELLPKAMNLKNGDAKFIKNAGGVVMHPFGSVMRSILVCVYEFKVKEVYVVAHLNCGMSNLNTEKLVEKIVKRGIGEETIDLLSNSGINVKEWLSGFESVESSLIQTVSEVKSHPLMPKDVAVHGLIMNPETGKLQLKIDGWDNLK
ncbi:MAG: beta-class carbonic anhydrase [Fusobacterium sp.]